MCSSPTAWPFHEEAISGRLELKTLRVVLAVLLVALRARAQAASPPREYRVPEHGRLALRVPDGWKDTSKAVERPPSVLLRFRPAAGDACYVQVIAVWLDPARLAKITPGSLKANVELTAADPLRGAVEKVATIAEFRGAQALGYSYTLTDRAPPPGEYKFVTQGELLVGDLLTTFTILYRDGGLPDKTLALAMLADATYSP
jgi:hypothetical protein